MNQASAMLGHGIGELGDWPGKTSVKVRRPTPVTVLRAKPGAGKALPGWRRQVGTIGGEPHPLGAANADVRAVVHLLLLHALCHRSRDRLGAAGAPSFVLHDQIRVRAALLEEVIDLARAM
jgi:hypothetical protein